MRRYGRSGFAFLAVLPAILLGIIWGIYRWRADEGNATVFSVDGEPVSKAEFAGCMSDLRAEIFQYFVEKHGAGDSGEFWHANFNGEVPIEVLKLRALERLKRIKTEQIVMKGKGLAQDISYGGYLQIFREENERRRKALQEGKPVYGPMQYEERTYYHVLHGNRVAEAKRRLANEDWRLSGSEIDQRYEKMIADMVAGAKIEINRNVYERIGD
jgi:hypothetical protein